MFRKEEEGKNRKVLRPYVHRDVFLLSFWLFGACEFFFSLKSKECTSTKRANGALPKAVTIVIL